MAKNTMRLSTAIRKGITRFPEQITQAYFKGDKACALGCAIFTVYGSADDFMIDELVDDFPELWESEHHIRPAGLRSHYVTDNLKDVIVILNDDIGWTREQIADWLESEGL